MSKTDHLARAKDYWAIAESTNSKIEAYRKTVDEIESAIAEGASQAGAARFLDRDVSTVRTLRRWHAEYAGVGDPPPPFGGTAQNEARYARADRRKVEDVIAERPEAVVDAIAQASPEAQRKIADDLVRHSSTERSLRAAAAPSERKPREPKAIEQRLSAATFSLWEIGEALLDEVPTPEERLRMLATAEKAQQLAAGITYLLDTGKLEDEFRTLVEEVGADS